MVRLFSSSFSQKIKIKIKKVIALNYSYFQEELGFPINNILADSDFDFLCSFFSLADSPHPCEIIFSFPLFDLFCPIGLLASELIVSRSASMIWYRYGFFSSETGWFPLAGVLEPGDFFFISFHTFFLLLFKSFPFSFNSTNSTNSKLTFLFQISRFAVILILICNGAQMFLNFWTEGASFWRFGSNPFSMTSTILSSCNHPESHLAFLFLYLPQR